jgi:hypothetical protein
MLRADSKVLQARVQFICASGPSRAEREAVGARLSQDEFLAARDRPQSRHLSSEARANLTTILYPFSVKLALGDSVRMSVAEHDAMHVYRKLVDDLLSRAEQIKKDAQIEPPLTEAHLGESIWAIQVEEERLVEQLSQQTRFAAVELAFREKFYSLLV